MYRAWAGKRRMQIRDLRSPNGSPATRDPILLVSGFGAYRVLSAEAGLHVFEPSEGAATRVVARVRTEAVPLGPLSGAEDDNAIVLALNTRCARTMSCGATASSRRWCATRPANGEQAASTSCLAARSISCRALPANGQISRDPSGRNAGQYRAARGSSRSAP
jgi:hypothetical protein